MAKRKNKSTQEIPDVPETYFQKRMAALGITNTNDYGFEVESLEFHGTKSFFPLFAETQNGSIQINYPCLYGGAEPVKNGEGEFFRTRNNPANNPEFKYYQEPGSGAHIFFPIPIIEKFSKREKIETLYVVEGEFKAQAGSMNGLDIVGIGGKDLFKDSDKKGLHEDLLAVIKKCDVQNLVLLLDGDVKIVYWENPEDDPYKDLSKRLYGFYSTVATFRELAKGEVRDVYFMHLRERLLIEAKGLDDLYEVRKDSPESVTADLLRLKSARAYFECENISNDSLTRIKGYFLLNYTKGVPSTFYFSHSHIIEDREFTFNGGRYKFDKANEGLTLTRHPDSEHYLRVGTGYYKKIEVPNSHKPKILMKKLKEWSKPEIKMDYVDSKGVKNFFDTIPKYNDFCNVPCNTKEYQQVVENCFNLYFNCEHNIQSGDWSTIEKYLKHVFGENMLASGFTNYELALDYFTMLYKKPTQKLPIICLVNKEKNTGKSTMIWLMKSIFKENATLIGNDELRDHMNDDWVSKLVICIDEGFIEKKVVLERLKSMSTSDFIKIRGMYKGRSEIGFFGKFVITTNDEKSFAAIDKDETRFWVNKVPVLKEDDPLIVSKMEKEVPAFLHYLESREVLHPMVSRHWFDAKLLHNEALQNLKDNSVSWLEKEIRTTFKELFFEYEYHTLYFTIKEIMIILNGGEAAVKFRKDAVNECLKDVFGYENYNARYDMPIHPDKRGNGAGIFEQKKGRCYTFKIEDFIKIEEIQKQFKYYSMDDISLFRESMGDAVPEETGASSEDDIPF